MKNKQTRLLLYPSSNPTGEQTYKIVKLVNRESISDRAGKDFRVNDFLSSSTVKWLCEDKNIEVTIVSQG